MVEYVIVMLLLGAAPGDTQRVLIAERVEPAACQRLADRLTGLAQVAGHPEQVYVCERREKL